MNKIKSYNDFINEEINWRKGLAGAALGTSLALSTPTISKGQEDVNKIEMSVSSVRNSKDPILNDILSEIKSNFGSEDNDKYNELYNKLATHLSSKYQFKIEDKAIKNITKEEASGLTMFEIIGWLGSICLAISGLPQAWMSYKDKHSRGISWSFILLWAFGEVFALTYVYDKLDLPLVTNYITNILIIGVILYFKITGDNKHQNDISISDNKE